MGNTIKGITVEIGGDTSNLGKALDSVNKQSKDLQTELTQVNKQLKFDPTNTVLLKQKQDLLKQSVEKTKSKLDTLTQAQGEAKKRAEADKSQEKYYRNFQREVEDTKSKLKYLEDQQKQVNKQASKLTDISNGFDKFSEKAGNVATKTKYISGGIALASGAAIKLGNDFEKQMSRVQGITGSTGEEIEKLRNQAVDLGSSTTFSASEAAQGVENLGSVGFSTQEIMSAMPGLLDLAASSGEDLATSSDIAASALRGFGIDASQAGHVADVLAKNAASTNAAVADTGEALKYAAPVAKTAGWSLETVTAAIGEMANAGIKGSHAGTTLRGMFVRIAKPSKEAASSMKELGMSFYDADGKMKSLPNIINEVQTKTAGLSEKQKQNALSTIFGTEALSGLMVMSNAGADSLSKLSESYVSSDGEAKKMANTMTDNVSGSIEAAKGAVETLAIKIQQILAPIVKSIADRLAELANKFSNLSNGQQKAILIALAFVAAISPIAKIISGISVGFRALIAITQGIKVAIAFVKGFEIATKAAAVASKLAAAGQWLLNIAMNANPVALIIIGVVALIAIIVVLWKKCDAFRNFFIKMGKGIAIAFKAVVSGIKTGVHAIGSFFTNLGNGIKNVFKEIINFIKSDWKQILLFILNPFAGAFALLYKHNKKFRDFINGLIKHIKDAFKAIPEFFSGIWDKIKEKFTTIGSKIGDAFSGAFKAVVNSVLQFIEDRMNGVVSAINTALGVINKIPGVNIGMMDMFDLPQLATGGIVKNGKAIIAEAGPELLSVTNGVATVTPLTGKSVNTNVQRQQEQQRSDNNNRPKNAIFQVFMDGKQFAEATVPYADVMQGKVVALKTRGLA